MESFSSNGTGCEPVTLLKTGFIGYVFLFFVVAVVVVFLHECLELLCK